LNSAPVPKDAGARLNPELKAYLDSMKAEILQAVRAQAVAAPQRQAGPPKDPCLLCGLDNHQAEGCRIYHDWLRRLARIKELGKCTRCLAQGCNELCTPYPCTACKQGLHPRFLCQTLPPCQPLKRRQPSASMGAPSKRTRPTDRK